MMNSTDGEACFPSSSSFNTTPFDTVSDVSDDETEDLDEDSEYPSDGSTYGSTNDADSDDDGEFDDSETEAGSVDSYDMADVDVDWSDESGFQSHAGDNNSNNKGKRKAAANDQGYGGFSRRKGGEDDANGRRKRQKGGNNSRPNRSFEEEGEDEEKRPLACPYYKHNPQEHVDCVEWSDRSLSRVKAHVLRGHLKPIQCDRCGKYRAGDNGQIRTHLRNSNCEKPARFIPVDERIVQMGDDLKKSSGKARTWKQVYMILFECEEEDVPSPCS
ncbi:hypothetical protein BDD12DRAFT_52222 [Trichophaea hybrida]|nr:hypothetical protein BDD12DRAFT_52222 [Trichophaea hybrida]